MLKVTGSMPVYRSIQGHISFCGSTNTEVLSQYVSDRGRYVMDATFYGTTECREFKISYPGRDEASILLYLHFL
jgi:hypothetical protein